MAIVHSDVGLPEGKQKKKGMTDHAPNQKIDPAFNSQARTDNLGDG